VSGAIRATIEANSAANEPEERKMRKLVVAASAVALLAGISMASAADVTGTIKSIDSATMMITLDNGQSFKLPATVKATDWKVGDKVKVTTDDKNNVTALTKS
jgi:hypothetical protein